MRQITEYDEDGHQVKVMDWLEGECIRDREYAYDEAGRLAAVSDYSTGEAERELVSRTRYLYDAAGNPIRESESEYHSEIEVRKASITMQYGYVYEE